MELSEIMQIGSGLTPAILVWIASEIRGVRRDLANTEKRIGVLEGVVFLKGVSA